MLLVYCHPIRARTLNRRLVAWRAESIIEIIDRCVGPKSRSTRRKPVHAQCDTLKDKERVGRGEDDNQPLHDLHSVTLVHTHLRWGKSLRHRRQINLQRRVERTANEGLTLVSVWGSVRDLGDVSLEPCFQTFLVSQNASEVFLHHLSSLRWSRSIFGDV